MDIFRYFIHVAELILRFFFQSCFPALTTVIALTKIPNEDKDEIFSIFVLIQNTEKGEIFHRNLFRYQNIIE